MQRIRVGLAQAESVVGGVPKNLATALDLIGQAGRASCDVVLFCELYLQACTIEADFASTAVGAEDEALNAVAASARTNNLSVVMGLARRDDAFPHNIYNSAAVFSPAGLLGFYDKLQVANYATYNEAVSFARGSWPKTFDLPFGRVGVSICYDIMFPEISLSLALQGAVMQLIPSAGGGEFKSDWDALLAVRGKENQMFVAYCNAVGVQGGDHFIGRSRVAGPDGKVRGQAKEGEADFVVVEIDLDDVRGERHRRPIFRDRPTLAAAVQAFGRADAAQA